jgi:Eukaryotic aspartyl protease
MGALDKPIFAIKMNRSDDSELMLGGANRSQYTGNVTWVSLSDKSDKVCHTHYSVSNVGADKTIFG